MNKKEQRQAIYDKHNGKCAYCGDELEYKAMQVDHVIPKLNFDREIKNKVFVPDFLNHLTESDLNHLDNLNPSCRQCNFYKSAHRLEFFRAQMKDIHKRIMKPFISRLGAKYGIVQINNWDGIFYFERNN